MFFTIADAAKLAKVDRSTIHRYIKSGKLSAVNDQGGRKMLDAAELKRVFANFSPPESDVQQADVLQLQQSATLENSQLKAENQHLRTMLQQKDEHIVDLRSSIRLLEYHRESAPAATEKKDWTEKVLSVLNFIGIILVALALIFFGSRLLG